MRIYTINTNNYIQDLQAPDWVEVITDVEDLGNPVRSSRKDKILCPFVDVDSVYVDASRVHLLNSKFLDLCEEILSKDVFFVMQHPHKHSYLEECAEYVQREWVDEDTLYQYTCELKSSGFDFTKHFSPLCTILWRKSGMGDFNEMWWKWYNRGGVRDQISFSAALQMSNQKFEFHYCRDVINRFSDASSRGVWWDVRQGDYKFAVRKTQEETPIDFIRKLSKLTGLSMFRYRTGYDRNGRLIFGDQ